MQLTKVFTNGGGINIKRSGRRSKSGGSEHNGSGASSNAGQDAEDSGRQEQYISCRLLIYTARRINLQSSIITKDRQPFLPWAGW